MGLLGGNPGGGNIVRSKCYWRVSVTGELILTTYTCGLISSLLEIGSHSQ